MQSFTRLDNGRLETHIRIADGILNPSYGISSEHITAPRPCWRDNASLHRRYLLQKMQPGQILCIDGAEVYRKKTANKWIVAGEDYYLDAAVEALCAELSTGKPPRPFYKLVPMQKAILRFWKDYERENGHVPVIAEASRALKKSVQLIGGLITEMGEWQIMHVEGGKYREKETHWHVNYEKLTLVDLS